MLFRLTIWPNWRGLASQIWKTQMSVRSVAGCVRHAQRRKRLALNPYANPKYGRVQNSEDKRDPTQPQNYWRNRYLDGQRTTAIRPK